MNTQMLRKWNSFMADKGKVGVVSIGDQTNHNIPQAKAWSREKP